MFVSGRVEAKMAVLKIRVVTVIVGMLIFGIAVIIGVPANSDAHPSFNRDVLPILLQHCGECHQEGGKGHLESGLLLSTYEGVMKGTRHGPVIVPGNSFNSNLSLVIEGRGRPEINMPHGRKSLSKWHRLTIRRWINRGAQNN